MFLANLTILRLIKTLWAKKPANSYLCKLGALVSQIVFLADLTVSRFVSTVWAKMSEKSYIRELSAQVTQTVFLADMTVSRLITTVWAKISENSNLRDFGFLRLITTVCTKMSEKPQGNLEHKFHKSCSWKMWPFYGLLQLYERKRHKPRISASSVNKYNKSCP